MDAGSNPASPSCLYLIRAEQRYGNGDRVFTVAEQGVAADAWFEQQLGVQWFYGPGRDVRIGMELNF